VPSQPRPHRKEWPGAPEGFFTAEARGLAWLTEAEDVGGATVARVVAVGADFIELEQVATAPVTAEAAERFGRALAATHAAGAPAFGAAPPGWDGPAWIGRQPQDNRPESSWGRFYAEQRVRPFVHAAVRVGHLDPAAAQRLDRLCDVLSRGDFDDGRPPARLHGDLWAGNVLHSRDGVVLIDPAAHGGHGLTDLAMLALFGAPGLDRTLDAYAEAAGLPAGWRDLLGLHQLHPLAVHAVSHGPAYGEALADAAGPYE
jgi:fructosamine-3-kinase